MPARTPRRSEPRPPSGRATPGAEREQNEKNYMLYINNNNYYYYYYDYYIYIYIYICIYIYIYIYNNNYGI